ncbi:hypothetical protein [Demequina litorisediminis]|uniref:QcrA subunit N-terminal domain-containing protein n=1 Tax=Demequina litorisediminis TaxID=1849022 RepID=A0ABQ6I9P8_9MICO|nr:hypothetical protein GCM10025876_01800 [Demequina litorisediminis]
MSTPEHHEEPVTKNGFTDPGLADHRPRRADVEPKADRRAERQVAALFGLSVIGTVIALWAYFGLDAGDGSDVNAIHRVNLWIGIGIFLTMVGIGFGAIHWAKTLMRDHEMVEERHALRTSDENREAAIQNLKDGVADSGLGTPSESGTGVKRRSLLKGSLITAMAIAPLSLLVPQIGNMGADWNISKFRHTMWGPGVRLTRDPDGKPIKAADVTIGSVFHVIPDGLNKPGSPPQDGGEGQGCGAAASPQPRGPQDPEGPRGLVVRRRHRLLEDLHPRRLPCGAVRAADAPPAVPLPPVDLRRLGRRQGGLRSRKAPPAPACRSPWMTTATSSPRTTLTSPWARRIGRVSRVTPPPRPRPSRRRATDGRQG